MTIKTSPSEVEKGLILYVLKHFSEYNLFHESEKVIPNEIKLNF